MTLTAHDERLLKALALAIVDRPRATLKELAESAGVSKATLHRFCGTRDGLVAMLEDYGHTVIRQILEASQLQQAEPLEALRRLIAEHLRHRDMLNFLLFQYRAESLDMQATTERWGYYTEAVDAFFLRGQQGGVFRIDITAAVFTELFLSMLYGMVDAERYGRAASSSSASVLEQLFLQGALTQPQAGVRLRYIAGYSLGWPCRTRFRTMRGRCALPCSSRKMKAARLRADVLAGLTTSFALVPECIAFALVAHLNPLMGLYGAFILCTLTALFGGRPGMVSGAAGSMAVVIVALVVQHGVQYLLATVLLGGLIMIAFGVLRLGKLVRMVPHPVMLGFVNGLAIVIALAQLEHFKAGEQWLSGNPLYLMLGLVALTMAVVYLLPKLTRAAPPALVAILGVGLLVYLLNLPTRTLGDMAHIAGGLPPFALPQIPWTLETLGIIAPYAFLMAMVGILETLLTLNLTDEITESRGFPDRECVALGGANIVSGLFGGMGGCAMIGQTVINLSSGGRGRLSGVVAGVMILLFVLFLSPLIERIPLAALVGVMFVVSQQTFAWASLRVLNKVPLNDVLVIVAVTAITVATDLATAVFCGIVIAALDFAWKHARELYADIHDEADGSRLYRVHGTLFFASTTPFLNQFDPANDPQQVTLDCAHLSFVDYSAIAALKTLRERYAKAGKHLRVVHLSERCRQLFKRAGIQEA